MEPQEPEASIDRFETLIATVLLSGAAVVPMMVSLEGLAVFRFPNELAMITVAILGWVIAGSGLLLRPSSARVMWTHCRIPIVLAAATLGWVLLTAAASDALPLSMKAFPFIASSLSVAVLSSFALRRVSIVAVAAAIAIPVLLNVTVIALQAGRFWNPWVFEYDYQRMYKNALLGNPNDVGAYLTGPLVFFAALAVNGLPRRMLFLLGAIVCLAGIMISETLTAFAGTLVGVTVLGLLRYRIRGVIFPLSIIGILVVGTMAYEPLRTRVGYKVLAATNLDIDRVISRRLPAFATAWEMFEDHPLTGVGPGGFKQHYMEYRIKLASSWLRQFHSPYAALEESFREVHNDHLQILAESGFPAYVLLLAGSAAVASISFRRRSPEGEEGKTARLFALPLVASLMVVMITGFPLQLAPSAYTFALLGGACFAWRND